MSCYNTEYTHTQTHCFSYTHNTQTYLSCQLEKELHIFPLCTRWHLVDLDLKIGSPNIFLIFHSKKKDAIEQLMVNAKQDAAAAAAAEAANKADAEAGTPTGTQNQAKRSWWYWRRSQNVNQAAAVAPVNSQKSVKIEDKQESK